MSRILRQLALGALSLTLAAQGKPGSNLGFDPANLDPSVKACEDFYTYANGGWMKRNTIPSDKARWGSFEELMERNRAHVKAVLDETSPRRDWKKGSIEQQVGDFFASGMDEARIEKLGLKPLAADFKRIEGFKDLQGLPAFLGESHNLGLGGAFGFSVGQDAKESTRYLGSLSQGGLGLPDRDYYLLQDKKNVGIRTEYEAHVARVFGLAGEKPELAKAHARMVLDLETQLAQAAWSRVENRNPNKTYNKRTLDQLMAEAPGFDWKAYFQARGAQVAEVNLRQPSFFKAFGQLAQKVQAPQWRVYFKWNLLRSASAALPKAFVEESFAFNGKFLNGTPEQEPRWKRIQAATDGTLGEALGQLYVKKAFSPEAKQKVLDMVANMRAVLKERIEGLDWMGEATKKQAIRKLEAFGVKMAYPDHWRTYTFDVKRDDYYGNLRRARLFETRRNLAKLGKPIDRTEWGMTPPTVNAYYNASMNEIVFPAGILQPPFFDPKADMAVNYGAIGWVIGHEMTHGFDDSGSQFDADGNLKNWWTDADRKAYQSRADLVVKQYDAYEPLKGEHVNGKLTLGENIADLGGLKVAFAAWKKSLGAQPAPVLEGFTGEQRFFLGAAQVWRNHIRPEALSVRLKTDTHSPGHERVVGPMSNLPEFFDAFGCGDGQPMKREESQRPSIW
ncbi:MAG TPA: M13 family metallopeptidase [Holophagaceae bacterium]|nr:M13 family metallopeptidase [Holophagaceae bacterium]